MSEYHTPSPEQQAFYDWIDRGRGNLVLEAVAGAGKTHSLLEGMQRMQGAVCYTVFNKKNQIEAQEKTEKRGIARRGLDIKTAHGAGFSALRATMRNLKVDEKKIIKLAESRAHSEKELAATPFVARMVSFAKQVMFTGKEMSPEWTELCDRFGADESLPENSMDKIDALKFARDVLALDQRTWESAQCVDFDDMVYLAAQGHGKMWRYDWLLIDEAQDTNLARRKLARRMLLPSGRLIAVGDRHQALYAFTGADSAALDLIARDFNCERLPLSVSFRCPQSVVRHAQTYVNHIQAAPNAPEGEVRSLSMNMEKLIESGLLEPSEIPGKFPDEVEIVHNAVICRYNRPLAALAFALIRKNVRCRIEGRDIGKSLIALVSKWKTARTIEELRARLQKWLDTELQKAKAMRSEKRAQSAEDRYETLEVFMERCEEQGKDSVACVKAEIEQMFADNVTGMLVLSSIHKSKGREWPRVLWLQTEGGRPPRLEWEVETEVCCNYVATTRAQEELILLSIPEIN